MICLIPVHVFKFSTIKLATLFLSNTVAFTLWPCDVPFHILIYVGLFHVSVSHCRHFYIRYSLDSLTSSHLGVNSVMKETLFRNHCNCSVD
jgi:hypothetical protein